MENKRPSLWRVIQIDYIAFVAIFLPIVFWIMYLFNFNQSEFLYVALIATFVGVFTLIGRYWMILSVFAQGMEAAATITEASFFRDRGHIAYTYTWQDEKYFSGVVVCKTKRTRSLRVGQDVILILNPDRPKRAFIRDLYL
jgi:hypothetical protein